MIFKNEFEICEKIKDLLFPYFTNEFDKIVIKIILTNNFNKRGIRVLLKDGSIRCISNYKNIPEDDRDKMFDLFKELKKQMKNKYDYWNNCFFYITKDNRYELDFICNPNGDWEGIEVNPPKIIQDKINQVNGK